VPWSLALDTCSTQRSPVLRVQTHGPSNLDTHLFPLHNNSSVDLTTTNLQRSGRITNLMRSGRTTLQDSAFSSPTHPGVTLSRRAWVRLNCLLTGVGRFRSSLYKWGMASSAACECGAEEQNRRPCCPPMSKPLTSSWTARA